MQISEISQARLLHPLPTPGYLSDYPWRCLWRGFSQMMRTTPLRRTTLHFMQIFFTDALTFICSPHTGTWPMIHFLPLIYLAR